MKLHQLEPVQVTGSAPTNILVGTTQRPVPKYMKSVFIRPVGAAIYLVDHTYAGSPTHSAFAIPDGGFYEVQHPTDSEIWVKVDAGSAMVYVTANIEKQET